MDAAWNDLQLYHHLQVVDKVDVKDKVGRQEHHGVSHQGAGKAPVVREMLPLALFSDKVPAAEQRALADAITVHKPGDLPMRAPTERFGTNLGKPKFPVLSASIRLADLANADCWFGIQHLHIDPAFISLNDEDWATTAAFQAGLANVQVINTVNDCAERDVKLTSDFVGSAKSEQHLQNVLQAVEHDRSVRPNLRRSTRKRGNVAK